MEQSGESYHTLFLPARRADPAAPRGDGPIPSGFQRSWVVLRPQQGGMGREVGQAVEEGGEEGGGRPLALRALVPGLRTVGRFGVRQRAGPELVAVADAAGGPGRGASVDVSTCRGPRARRAGIGAGCARPTRAPPTRPAHGGVGRARHAGPRPPSEPTMRSVGGPKAPPGARQPLAPSPTATAAPPNAVPTTPSATGLPPPGTKPPPASPAPATGSNDSHNTPCAWTCACACTCTCTCTCTT